MVCVLFYSATTPAPSMSPAPTGELVTSPTLEPTLSLFNSTTAPSISCGVMPDECGEENKCCAGYKCIPIFRKKFCIKGKIFHERNKILVYSQ